MKNKYLVFGIIGFILTLLNYFFVYKIETWTRYFNFFAGTFCLLAGLYFIKIWRKEKQEVNNMKNKKRWHYHFGAKKFTHGIVESWITAIRKIEKGDSFFVSRSIYDLLIELKIECIVYKMGRYSYFVRGV